MMQQTFEQIVTDIQNEVYHPVYFLTGEEPYYIDRVSDLIQESVLSEEEKTFNQIILYGKDADAVTVMNAAKRFPMMSTRQVVIVKEAQEIKDIDNLFHYIENPLKSTLLVLDYKYKKPDKRKKVFKSLLANSVYLDSRKLYDNEVPAWISAYVSSKNYSIEPKASALLVEFLGTELSKISNEIDKLIIALGQEEKMITSGLIERNIGISKDFNNFELQNAIGKKDILKANRIINYFAGNQKSHPLVLTINTLYSFFSKLLIYYWINDKSRDNLAEKLGVRPFFVKDYIEASRNYNANKVIQVIGILREYDLKSKGYKGITLAPGDLLKEMVFKILH